MFWPLINEKYVLRLGLVLKYCREEKQMIITGSGVECLWGGESLMKVDGWNYVVPMRLGTMYEGPTYKDE